MKKLKFIIDIEGNNVKTEGFEKDGNISLDEAGLIHTDLTDKEEITEYLEERYSDYEVTVEFMKTTTKINKSELIGVNNLVGNDYFTIKNINKKYDEAVKITEQYPALKDGKNFYDQGMQFYDTDEDIKDVIDTWIQKLNELAAKHSKSDDKKLTDDAVIRRKEESKKEDKEQNKTADTPKRKAKAKKTDPTPAKKERYGTYHRSLPVELTYIRRFVNFDGKAVSKEDIKNFISKIENDNSKDLFSIKTSNWGKEITYIHNRLHNLKDTIKKGENKTLNLNKNDNAMLKKFIVALEQNKQCTAVRFVVRFNNLYKKPTKEKAQRLLKNIENAIKKGGIIKEDEFYPDVKKIVTSLKRYIDTGELTITKANLRGLAGIEGCISDDEKKNCINEDNDELGALPVVPFATGAAAIITANEVMDRRRELRKKREETKTGRNAIISSEELKRLTFETINLTGDFKELFGDPTYNARYLFHGPAKHGKSTCAIKYAKRLAEMNIGKVLYCGIEEKFGYTMQEKFQRLDASHENLYLAETMPDNIEDYQFIFIDSITRAKMTGEDLSNLFNKYPEKSFLVITHNTKEGKHRGDNSFIHDVDVIINVEEGVAHATGRFSPAGSLKLFEWEENKEEEEKKEYAEIEQENEKII